jgi:hypothetical protein
MQALLGVLRLWVGTIIHVFRLRRSLLIENLDLRSSWQQYKRGTLAPDSQPWTGCFYAKFFSP